jgi:hypothetical protein
LSRESARIAGVILTLAGVFAVAISIGTGWRSSSAPDHLRPSVQAPQGDDNLTRGSIVYMPDVGDDCRQKEIDNATWRVREVGIVPCQQALATKSGGGPGAGGSRIDIIRQSFRKTSP